MPTTTLLSIVRTCNTRLKNRESIPYARHDLDALDTELRALAQAVARLQKKVATKQKNLARKKDKLLSTSTRKQDGNYVRTLARRYAFIYKKHDGSEVKTSEIAALLCAHAKPNVVHKWVRKFPNEKWRKNAMDIDTASHIIEQFENSDVEEVLSVEEVSMLQQLSKIELMGSKEFQKLCGKIASRLKF